MARPEGRPLTRAAILFATATTAATAFACGKSPADPDPVVVQPYGVPVTPPPDAEPPPPTPDASTPVVVQPYGVPVPPPDAGPKAKPIPTNAVPAYGVPPPTKH